MPQPLMPKKLKFNHSIRTYKTFWNKYKKKKANKKTNKQDVPFIIGDWNAKEGSQEILGVTGKLSLGVQNEAGQRLK